MKPKYYIMDLSRFLSQETNMILVTAQQLNIDYIWSATNSKVIIFKDISLKDFIALGKLAGVYCEEKDLA